MSAVGAIGPERAAQYAAKLFKLRCEGWGDEPRALEDVSGWCGMSTRSFKRLMKGQTKEVGVGMFTRVRGAYLDYCARMVRNLQHEIAIESERYGDDAFEDLGAEASVLAEKIKAAKERIG